jgi:hypothetical protein
MGASEPESVVASTVASYGDVASGTPPPPLSGVPGFEDVVPHPATTIAQRKVTIEASAYIEGADLPMVHLDRESTVSRHARHRVPRRAEDRVAW